ncbi:MAG: phosphate ABC transporter substrate-binding protein [Gammaproteobacteria bacterium]|nr:phosphate ABC transporter substrate-binding protein [Gammaproteobacteria bacterium]
MCRARIRLNALCAFLLLMVACSGEPQQSADAGAPSEKLTGQLTGQLTLTGSSTVAPLIGEIAKRFEQTHPGTRVDVQTGGSSRGVADARRGTADIGMVSRALNADEGDLTAYPIALDGVAMILHRDNPLPALSEEQIVAIYTGQVTNWREIGGADAPITVVNKAEGRSTLELFLGYFKLRNEDIKPSIIIGDNQQGIRTVAADPNAIGYVSIGTATYEASRGTAIKALSMRGVEASLENVRNGSFPLSRPLHLVTLGAAEQASALARSFIEYAASAEVSDLTEAQYFVPLTQ